MGVGPGPFTGLRVGIVTGRTFAFALGIPVHGLCSLDALAARGVAVRPPRRTSSSPPTPAARRCMPLATSSATPAPRASGLPR